MVKSLPTVLLMSARRAVDGGSDRRDAAVYRVKLYAGIVTERVSGDIYDAIAANDQAHPQ